MNRDVDCFHDTAPVARVAFGTVHSLRIFFTVDASPR